MISLSSQPTIWSAVSLLLNILLGGGLWAVWLRYRVLKRTEDRVDFSTLLEEVKGQRDQEKQLREEQNKRIGQLEVEIQGLRLARDLDPFPMWITDIVGNCLHANSKFDELFLRPAGKSCSDVIGQGHEYIFPKPFSRAIAALDADAKARPDGTARGVGTFEIPNYGKSTVTVHRFPIRMKPSGVIVAYAGYITHVDPDTRMIG